MIEKVLERYGLDPASQAELITGGLINRTWKVLASDGRTYIFQKINHQVFKDPQAVANNIAAMDYYLKKNHPDYLFTSPLRTQDGKDLIYLEGGYFRAFDNIAGSHTLNVVTTPEQAYEAAHQFGKFTKLLSGFDVSQLRLTIPDFHNLLLRFDQFKDALDHGNKHRISQAGELVRQLQQFSTIVEEFRKIVRDDLIKIRVTHHDTKISNVLFDANGKGLCVIDLDTVMPGFFISDLGDMMRTYLSPANEEEKDFSKIEIREEIFAAIINGYMRTMGDELSGVEQRFLLYAGPFLVYMQALRFLADHFRNDVYYGATYPDHNLVRAGNQVVLLQKIDEKKGRLQEIVRAEASTRKHFFM